MKKALLSALLVLTSTLGFGQLTPEFPFLLVEGASHPFSLNQIIDSLKVVNHSENIEFKLDSGSFELTATKLGPGKVSLHLYQNSDTVLFEEEFYVIQVPAPKIFIDGLSSGVASREELLNSKGLKAEVFDHQIFGCVNYRVKSFTIVLMKKSGDYELIRNLGCSFSDETTRKLRTLNSGDILLLKDIIVSPYRREEIRTIEIMIK